MTIAERNKVRITGIVFMSLASLISLSAVLALFLKGNLGTYSEAEAALLSKFAIMSYNKTAVCLGIAAFPLFSSGLLIYIYISFKKTHAIEMSFFVIFLISIGFESLRLVFPFHGFSNIPPENIAYISRLIYVARLTGIISLFMGSIFAVKIISRQISYILFFMFFIAFSLVFSMPVNNFYSGGYFFSGTAYYYPYTAVSMVTTTLACITYFFAYILKNAKEYLKAAAAMFFLMTGYWLLIYTQDYLTLIIGSILFTTATIFFIRSIHGYYLWQ